MARYIGLDVHKASCTMVVLGPSGKKLRSHVVETNASVLIELVKTIPRPRHLCFEEGTQSAWLYEVLSPHADETVVTVKQERRGNKDDERDAFSLADTLRTNSVKVRVYKDVGRYGPLRELCRVHSMQVADSVRVQNRILSLYRSRGITTSDSLYKPEQRADWIGMLPHRMQAAAGFLLRQYDAVEPLRREVEKAMVTEARKQSVSKLLATVPGLGPIRVAHLMSVVVSPHRFRSRDQLCQYAGLGVVTRSSSDYVQGDDGKWRKAKVQQTRGLNRNHNHELKSIFKGAATTVIGRAQKDCPIYHHYELMLANKTKPNLAKLTIARQIAAITLSLWKKEVAYDPAKLIKNS
jgi:transposase